MTTLQEDLENLHLAARNFGRAVTDTLRQDLRKLRRKMKPIIDVLDNSKIYQEYGEEDDHDTKDVSCTWCERGIDHFRMIWEPATGYLYSFCPNCGYELNLVEEGNLPKLSKEEAQEILDAKESR